MNKQLSIKYKIIAITLAISIPAMFLSNIIILYVNMNSFKHQILENSITDVKLVSELITAPLVFDYKDQVDEILEKLAKKEDVSSIIVLDIKKNIFSKLCSDTTIVIPKILADSLGVFLYEFKDNHLQIDYPIFFESEKYGNLILNIKTDFNSYLYRSIKTIVLIGFIITLLSFIVISALQKVITKPILRLSKITAQISKKQDYKIKVSTRANDEIGLLYQEFQRLLDSLYTKEQENAGIVDKLRKSQQTLLKTQSIAGIGSWERDFITNKVIWSDEEYNIFELKKNDELGFETIMLKLAIEDKPKFSKMWNLAMSGKAEYNIEFRYHCSNGVKWLHERAEFEFNDEGKAINAFGFTYDITKRKEQEIELLKHRNNLEELVQKRTNEVIQLYSDIAIKNELLYKMNKELSQEKQKVTEQSQKLSSVNNNLVKKTLELENTLTILKSAQSQLVQQEKMASLGTLTAGIAHEINNPINFISSNMSGLESVVDDLSDETIRILKLNHEIPEENSIPEEISIHLSNLQLLIENIKIGINRTVEIIKSLRTFSRANEENFSAADINQNIDSTLLLLKNQYKDKIEVIRNYGDIPLIFCSIGKINQVFMNLIVNALQSIEGAGTIEISTYIENNFLVVKISDTGSGIPEEIMDKIFEPFFTTKEIGKGTGLGLAISYNIIKNHNGEIKVSSKIGKGTSFFVFLPNN
jgi:signal transduction histidine kinase/HAMP domain-containing protein